VSSYEERLRAHATPPRPIVPEIEVDPATLDAVHTGISTDQRVTAYVSGRLQFDRVEIDGTDDLDQLAVSVVEAVNAAMTAAQAPMGGGPTGLEAQQEAMVVEFEANLDRMDAQMDQLMAKLDDLDDQL